MAHDHGCLANQNAGIVLYNDPVILPNHRRYEKRQTNCTGPQMIPGPEMILINDTAN